MLRTILGNEYEITLGLDVETELSSLDGYFDGSNYNKLEGKRIGYCFGYSDGEVMGYEKCINLGSTDGKLLDTIFGNADGIIPDIDV